MKLASKTIALLTFIMAGVCSPACAVEIEYPQIIKTRYEALDAKNGGNLVIWSESEKIHYCLDPKLFPPPNMSKLRR